MHIKGVRLAILEPSKCLMIRVEVPMVMSESPDEIREMLIDFIILHLSQRFVQLAVIPRFKHTVSLMARRTLTKKIGQQVTILLEPELPVVGDLHRFIDEQIPGIGPVPIRRPQEPGMCSE
jgi:hypothetical protein